MLAGSLSAQILPDAWERSYPSPSAESLKSVVWGSPGFVGVGNQREMVFSANGTNWQRVIHEKLLNPSYTDFQCVSWAGGSYFVPAGAGRLLRSVDGLVWTMVEMGTQLPLRFVHFANGMWEVFSDSDQKMLVSQDLVQWQAHTLPTKFISIVQAGSQTVALGQNGEIYISGDSVNWTAYTPPWATGFYGPSINKICFGAAGFVAVGGYSNGGTAKIYRSSDAISWSDATITPTAWGPLSDCTYANGLYVAVGSYDFLSGWSRTIITSSNGSDWSVISSSQDAFPGMSFSSISAQPGGKFVVVGGNGIIQVSDDGQSWNALGSPIREYLNRVLFADGRFVAVGGRSWNIGGPAGGGTMFSSGDGLTWNAFRPSHPDLLSDVAYGNGKWVVTGDDGGVFTSSDSIQWSDASISIGTHDLRRVVFFNGSFHAYAANRDTVYSSINGVQWTRTDGPPVANIKQAKSLNDQIAATTNDGSVMFSNDGLTWTVHPGIIPEGINSISFGKGRWVVGGYFATAYSLDGVQWHVSPAPMQVYDIDYVNGHFIASGYEAMLESADGVSWKPMPAPAVTASSLSSLAHGNGVVVCAGVLSLYRAALPAITHRTLPELIGPEMIEFFGEPGRQYRMLESNDLNAWQAVSGWREGLGDYLTWPALRTGTFSRFWRVEWK